MLKTGKNERPQRGAPREARRTRLLWGHTATPTSRPARAHMGVNHYAGPCARIREPGCGPARCTAPKRNSTTPFVRKLFRGPSLAVETHARDASMVVQAFVSTSCTHISVSTCSTTNLTGSTKIL
ncbi:hypothetical protein B0H13DRAFT_2081214, partial [Mycena leptocephala]